MAKVYRADDLLEGGEPVALKLYPPGTPPEMLRREFLALKALRHPGIARAYHFGASETDGRPFFTMERVEGEPLDRFLSPAREEWKRSGSAAVRNRFLSAGLDLFLQAA